MAHVKPVATRQRKDGKLVRKYRVLWREPMRDDYGVPLRGRYRTRSETYALRADADARRDELNAARHTTGTATLSEQRKAGELPLGYYARQWLDALAVQVASGRPRQATADEYARLLHCYVLPHLGDTAVARMDAARCEQFLAALVRQPSRQGDCKPLSPGTVKHVWDVLRRVLRYAVKHKAIAANPCAGIEFKTGKRNRFEHHPLIAEQIGQLSAAIAGDPPGDYIGPALPAYPVYALMVEFMAYTGLRAGEVSGLEVADIVFAPSPDPNALKATVQVRRTKQRKGGQWVTGALKTETSRRDVPLPPWLAAKMADYLAEHPRADEPTAPLWPSRRNGGGYRAKGKRYAVPLDWSQPLALGTFYDTVMKPALEAIGLPASRPATPTTPAVRGVRVHDLRHTAAVLYLTGAGGQVAPVHYMRVAQLLGHATNTVTLDTYGDWIEQDDPAPAPLPAPPVPARSPATVVPLRQQTR